MPDLALVLSSSAIIFGDMFGSVRIQGLCFPYPDIPMAIVLFSASNTIFTLNSDPASPYISSKKKGKHGAGKGDKINNQEIPILNAEKGQIRGKKSIH